MSLDIVRPELYARAVELVMSYEPISDRDAEILADYEHPKPVENPVYDSELADPLNTTGQRKQTQKTSAGLAYTDLRGKSLAWHLHGT